MRMKKVMMMMVALLCCIGAMAQGNQASEEAYLQFLYQYMPIQYKKVRDGKLKKDAKSLLMSTCRCPTGQTIRATSIARMYSYRCRHAKKWLGAKPSPSGSSSISCFPCV